MNKKNKTKPRYTPPLKPEISELGLTSQDINLIGFGSEIGKIKFKNVNHKFTSEEIKKIVGELQKDVDFVRIIRYLEKT